MRKSLSSGFSAVAVLSALASQLSYASATSPAALYEVQKLGPNDVYYTAQYVTDPLSSTISSNPTPYLKVDFFASLPSGAATSTVTGASAFPSTEDVSGCCLNVDLTYTIKDSAGSTLPEKTIAMNPESSARFSTILQSGSNSLGAAIPLPGAPISGLTVPIAGVKYRFKFSRRDGKVAPDGNALSTKDSAFVAASTNSATTNPLGLPGAPGSLDAFDLSKLPGVPSAGPGVGGIQFPSLDTNGMPVLPEGLGSGLVLPGSTTSSSSASASQPVATPAEPWRVAVPSTKPGDIVVTAGPVTGTGNTNPNTASFVAVTGNGTTAHKLAWCDLLTRMAPTEKVASLKGLGKLTTLTTAQAEMTSALSRVQMKAETTTNTGAAAVVTKWTVPKMAFASSSVDTSALSLLYQVTCSESGQNEVVSAVQVYTPKSGTITQILPALQNTVFNVSQTLRARITTSVAAPSTGSSLMNPLGLAGLPTGPTAPTGPTGTASSVPLDPSGLLGGLPTAFADPTAISTTTPAASAAVIDTKKYYDISFYSTDTKETPTYAIFQYSVNDAKQSAIQMKQVDSVMGPLGPLLPENPLDDMAGGLPDLFPTPPTGTGPPTGPTTPPTGLPTGPTAPSTTPPTGLPGLPDASTGVPNLPGMPTPPTGTPATTLSLLAARAQRMTAMALDPITGNTIVAGDGMLAITSVGSEATGTPTTLTNTSAPNPLNPLGNLPGAPGSTGGNTSPPGLPGAPTGGLPGAPTGAPGAPTGAPGAPTGAPGAPTGGLPTLPGMPTDATTPPTIPGLPTGTTPTAPTVPGTGNNTANPTTPTTPTPSTPAVDNSDTSLTAEKPVGSFVASRVGGQINDIIAFKIQYAISGKSAVTSEEFKFKITDIQ